MKKNRKTSKWLSGELKNRGYDLSPEAVRQWIGRGAPGDDPEAFLRFYKENRESSKQVPRCFPQDPTFALIELFRALRGVQELGAVAEEYIDNLPMADIKGGPDTWLAGLALAGKRMGNFFKYGAAFLGALELHHRPESITPEAKAVIEDLFLRGGLDVNMAIREMLPLPEPEAK
jgi:hypothetical protein